MIRNIVFSVALVGASALAEAVPDIGDQVEVTETDQMQRILTRSAQSFPFIQRTYDQVNFTIAYSEDHKVEYISTKDHGFHTDGGISMDSTLKEVLMVSGSKLRTERGWGAFVVLPSGWSAAFVQDSIESPLTPATKVQWFFKRR